MSNEWMGVAIGIYKSAGNELAFRVLSHQVGKVGRNEGFLCRACAVLLVSATTGGQAQCHNHHQGME